MTREEYIRQAHAGGDFGCRPVEEDEPAHHIEVRVQCSTDDPERVVREMTEAVRALGHAIPWRVATMPARLARRLWDTDPRVKSLLDRHGDAPDARQRAEVADRFWQRDVDGLRTAAEARLQEMLDATPADAVPRGDPWSG